MSDCSDFVPADSLTPQTASARTRARAPVNGGEERVDEVVGEPCVLVREAHVRLRAQLRYDLVLVVQPQDLPARLSTAL